MFYDSHMHTTNSDGRSTVTEMSSIFTKSTPNKPPKLGELLWKKRIF